MSRIAANGIAIIGGTGQQGFALALRWAKAGEHVIIGSRQSSKAAAAAERVRDAVGRDVQVEGCENAAAVSKTSLIVLTVPFAAQITILKSLKGSFKAGDILVDVTVPLEAAVGGRSTRLLGVWAGSAAEQAAEIVPNTVSVVSAFHTFGAAAFHDLNKSVDCDAFVCGDSREAKDVVKSLVELIPGARYVEAGPLQNSRITEALAALLISINLRYKVPSAGIRVTGLPVPAP